MSVTQVKTIPWNYQESPFAKSWTWTTDHFEAKVRSDGSRYVWTVSDLSKGRQIPLGSGPETSFTAAEDEVRELVGKSYPTRLGYRAYAGSLATTFRIYTGEVIDFGPLESSKVIMTVRTSEGVERILTGALRVVHHELHVVSESGTYRVSPSFIVKVSREFGGMGSSPSKARKLGKSGRLYEGELVPGCTGVLGYDPGTVDHPPRAPHCPIHE